MWLRTIVVRIGLVILVLLIGAINIACIQLILIIFDLI